MSCAGFPSLFVAQEQPEMIDHWANEVFGVRNATPETTTFLPAVMSRNLAAGLSLLTVLRSGETRLAGYMVLYFLFNGLADSWIILRRPGSAKLGVHVVITLLVAAAGLGLFQENH